MLKQRKAALGYRPSGEFLNGVLNKKLAAVLLKQAGIPMNLTCDRLKDAQLDTLTMQLKKFEVPVTSTNSFEQAQVCCGGVDTRDIRPDTLESKLVKGLFLVGELTDVDGIWSSDVCSSDLAAAITFSGPGVLELWLEERQGETKL